MEPKSSNHKENPAEIEAARARARAYQEQADALTEAGPDGSVKDVASKPKHPRAESAWNDVVGQAIDEAMRKGEFDNLRGKGKPLPKNENPFTPPGYELAFDILKNNDLAPGWLGTRNDTQREIEHWRATLRADVARVADGWLRAGAEVGAQDAVRGHWAVTRTRQRESMDALNRRIRDVNLQQPVSSMHLFMLRLAEEERRAGLPAELQ